MWFVLLFLSITIVIIYVNLNAKTKICQIMPRSDLHKIKTIQRDSQCMLNAKIFVACCFNSRGSYFKCYNLRYSINSETGKKIMEWIVMWIIQCNQCNPSTCRFNRYKVRCAIVCSCYVMVNRKRFLSNHLIPQLK